MVGPSRADAARPALKLTNALALLVLCYANAAVSLPQAVAEPDADFLAVLVAAVAVLCAANFAAGWLLGRLLRAEPGQRAALMFGLGMSNNGTGLVLGAAALAGQPRALLPLLVYNLLQHLAAAVVGPLLLRPVALGRGPAHGHPHPAH
jgi:BASS family bile acid:Na+ symporter